MDSDHDSDDCDYDMNTQRTNERRIEQQLDEFRIKWKKEIQQRTVYGHVLDDKQKEEEQQKEETRNNEEQAKHFFLRASDLEREGKPYDAIKYYRAAMQLVPNIEFVMARKNQQPQQQQTTTTTMEFDNQQENINNDMNTNVDNTDNLVESFQRANLDENELSTICTKSFPQESTHISSLPSEVLIYILRWVVSSDLDVRSLDQCARVCRGFYICARDPQLWKMICVKTWGAHTGNPLGNSTWRNMFINRPHVLFNGVYISRTTYVRQGEQSLDAFYAPWHLVEYFRYIRFFPDGMVLLYTSADEPRVTVARLKSRYSIRDGSITYGNYRLQKNRVIIVAKRMTQRVAPMTNPQRRNARDIPSSEIEQTMNMEFEMCDAGKKKHYQLKWTHYEMIFRNIKTGDERSTLLDVVNDHHVYPPLTFSRVKSYTFSAEQPLK